MQTCDFVRVCVCVCVCVCGGGTYVSWTIYYHNKRNSEIVTTLFSDLC